MQKRQFSGLLFNRAFLCFRTKSRFAKNENSFFEKSQKRSVLPRFRSFCKSRFLISSVRASRFSKIAKIAKRPTYGDSVILGGPKRHFFGLRTRCENKWAKKPKKFCNLFRSVTCDAHVQMPYVILKKMVIQSLPSSCFRTCLFFSLSQ